MATNGRTHEEWKKNSPEKLQELSQNRYEKYKEWVKKNTEERNNNIKFNISTDDNDYIDLIRFIRVFATLQNTHATRAHFLRPLSGLCGFCQR